MKKISLGDLMSIDAYEAQRPVIRKAIMEHKKTRRVPLGPNAMLHFEDYMVMRYQVLELIRAEKIEAEEELLGELEAYNPLIPDGKNLKVTFMLEYPDPKDREEKLKQLIGIEELISIKIGDTDPVYPIANEDLPRSTEEKTSSVHFLRFELEPGMIQALKSGESLTVGIGHPNYNLDGVTVPELVRESLIADLD